MYVCVQDTIVVVPPYPYNLEEDDPRITVMFPWKIVGMRVPSSSLPAFCVQRMDDCPKTQHTNPAQMILCLNWCSSAPLKSSSCPSRGLWKTQV